MNQLDFWHDDIDSRNINDGLEIFSWTWSKELSANQISGFLNQLYLKINLVNQGDFLLFDINFLKIKGDLKILVECDQKCFWPIRLQNS